uniref:Uncharacterized protein n=1 Tax=Strigops habroptila TaxID=2489341 RepID=A0A672V904_STRHB
MDQCMTVEQELEKVLQKFSGYGQLCESGLEELIQNAGGLHGTLDHVAQGSKRSTSVCKKLPPVHWCLKPEG